LCRAWASSPKNAPKAASYCPKSLINLFRLNGPVLRVEEEDADDAPLLARFASLACTRLDAWEGAGEAVTLGAGPASVANLFSTADSSACSWRMRASPAAMALAASPAAGRLCGATCWSSTMCFAASPPRPASDVFDLRLSCG
jgi:hypothetical protein